MPIFGMVADTLNEDAFVDNVEKNQVRAKNMNSDRRSKFHTQPTHFRKGRQALESFFQLIEVAFSLGITKLLQAKYI